MVTAVWPWEEGHAQERSRRGAVRETGAAEARWIAERLVWPRALLGEMATRGGCCVMREPQGLPCEIFSPLHADDRTPPGHHIASQRGCGVDAPGAQHGWRRLRLTGDHAPRAGATRLHLLSNLPRQGPATRVAPRSRHRWTWETAGQPCEAACHAAIKT